MPVFMDSLVFSAFMIGIISAVSLPLGALTSFVWKPDQRVVAALMAFGAGSLLAALTIDLVAVSLDAGHFEVLAIGCVIGGALFILLDNIVSNYGGYKRKFSTTLHYRQNQNKTKLKNTLSHLGRIEIFNDLSDDDVDFLAQNIDIKFYAAGSAVFTPGEAADRLYIIQSGSVRLISGQDADNEANLHDGDAFGRAALFTGCPYAMSARAVTNCYISAIPKESLENLLHASPSYRSHVLEWLESDEITDYLKNRHKIDDGVIAGWREELKESFEEECILPDIGEVERREDEFLRFSQSIKRVPWLEELDEEEAEALSGFLVYKRFEAGESLFVESEPAEYMFIIRSGEVELSSFKSQRSLHKQVCGDGV